MEINQLEALIAIAEERGFSRARDRLHRTQPAISQAIQRLEKEVGVKLFDRSSKDGTLTSAGKILFESGQQILKLRRNAKLKLRELTTLQNGKVVIGANEYTVQRLMPIVAAYQKLHPLIKIEVKRCLASRIPAEIIGTDIELGVLSFRPSAESLESVPLGTDEITLISPPGRVLGVGGEVSLRDLGAESFIAHNVPSPYRERVIQTFEEHGTPLNISMELPTLESIKRAVEEGMGLALIPRLAAEYEVSRGQLVASRVREMRLERELHLVYRNNEELSHAAKAFVKVARHQDGFHKG